MQTNGHTIGGNGERAARTGQVSVGPLWLDTVARRLYSNDTDVRLSPLEYRLLEVMLERSGEDLSRRDLLKYVWDTEAEIETRTVDMHIARLRSKLGDASSLIETVRGVGYRLRDDAEDGKRSGAKTRPPRRSRPARSASTFRALGRRDLRTG